MATDFKPAKAAYARSSPTGAITRWAYRHPARNPRASAVAISPITPSDSPRAEKRSGRSVPRTPAPSMSSAWPIGGGATRHGMAVAERGSGAEFMEDVIAEIGSDTASRVRLGGSESCGYFDTGRGALYA